MKIKELRAMPDEDLKTKLAELQKELMKENAQIAAGTVPKSPGKIRNAKKTIAKITMLLESKPAQSTSTKSTTGQKTAGGNEKA